MRNLLFENLNPLIIRDIWIVKIWPYFHKSIWVAIFVCFSISLFQEHFFENFTWGIIHMDFVGFTFRTYKFKNDMNYINTSFHIDLGMFIGDWIITFKKVTTMFIWIIIKNLVWPHWEYNFCWYWATLPCIHPKAFSLITIMLDVSMPSCNKMHVRCFRNFNILFKIKQIGQIYLDNWFITNAYTFLNNLVFLKNYKMLEIRWYHLG